MRISLLQLTVPLLAAFFSATHGSKDFADSLTRAIVEVVSYDIALEVPVAILHPSCSTFWSDASVLRLLQHKQSFKVCFHQCMHGGTQDLGDKATVLLNELLNKFDFPDTRLVKHTTQGFRLSGWLCKTGVFVPDPRPPSSTMEAQLKTAKVRNQATIAKLANQASDEVTQQAWGETQEAVARGWLFEDCDPALDSVLIARRFGLKQGQKVRVIDDCKACSFNSTAGLPEKYRLHGVEFIAAFLLRCMQDPRSTGIEISGRTLDLTSAYKQYALHSTDRDVLRIGVADCDSGKPRFFGVNALPFGATGSVPGFLRVAAALWHLGSRALGRGG